MEFDVIELSEEQILNFSTIQMQLLRTAQKSKNQLLYNLESDMAMFEKLLLTNNFNNSSLAGQQRAALIKNYEHELEIIVEQLRYSLARNEPLPDDGNGDGKPDAGYIVDYSLSYVDRYRLVRNYYMSIDDPDERLALYSADETAKDYLSSYYVSLFDVLASYCK